MRRLVVGILAGLALAPAAAIAKSAVLAELPEGGSIDALNGWVVWNAPEKEHHVLRAWHAGVVTDLRRRPTGFDFDLGTDLRGRTVATFTRCTHHGSGVELEGPLDNRGCRIRVLDLASGKERAAGVPRPAGMSHRTPAMWRGRIAYGEYKPYPGHGNAITQIRLWSPVSHRVLAKHHGALPTCRYRPCDPGPLPRIGWTDDMELGDRMLAFAWSAVTTDSDKPVLELRVEDSSGNSRSLATGGVGEGWGAAPWQPSIVGRRLWFGYSLFDPPRVQHWLYRYRSGSAKAARSHMSVHVRALARDHGTFYAVVGHGDASVYEGCTSDIPCTLERLGATVH